MLIVVALGGNALLAAGQTGTAGEQYENISVASKQLIALARKHDLVITHGNGPQVGKINLQNETARELTPPMPLDICGAMSQGQIGYMLQQGLSREIARQGLKKETAAIITRVQVDGNDPALLKPSKPIGSYYSREEAERRTREYNETWVEDKARGGWRKVVPSPLPCKIVEEKAILNLVEKGFLVIATGGGGIPVVSAGNCGFEGLEAVIDKDMVGEMLATILDADIYLILTDVPAVYLDYGKPTQVALGRINPEEMEQYHRQGHFSAGSMDPKVNAAIRFSRQKGKRAIITSLEKAVDALEGKAGTCLDKKIPLSAPGKMEKQCS